MTTDRDHAFAYLPLDRRVALANGHALPSDVRGTALEADLSGFTALTEALTKEYGEQRGAEELARRLNILYDGLLTEVHRYGGTVLYFSGDAFTSWLDGDDGSRAVTCAQLMQQWMGEHAAELRAGPAYPDVPLPRLKVAIATGRTHRFLIGDPDVQLLEVLAGRLVDDLAEVEHGAEPGEIVLTVSTRELLGERVTTGSRGELLTANLGPVEPVLADPDTITDAADVELARPWLPRQVFDRLAAGGGDFLAELRPVTAIFLRFGGIDYDGDPHAYDRLDTFTRVTQSIMRDYDGMLVQITIGDKGAYVYAVFGAPNAHEDDPTRALLAALQLRDLGGTDGLVEPVSIGVATGRLRAGAYGGRHRRNYGVIGDTVNLTARLMQAAAPGEIVVSRAVQSAARSGFRWTKPQELTVKGKAAPIPVISLEGVEAKGAVLATQTAWTTVLGRDDELQALRGHLDSAVDGAGHVLAITGEAGLGKTTLAVVLSRIAASSGVVVLHSECPSYGVTGSYVVWQRIWTALLGLDDVEPELRVEKVVQRLSDVGPQLAPRAPLLAPVLGLSMADTELTAGMDAKVRKTALEATLAEWLRAGVTRPMLIVIEDCHWIDPLSEDLLEAVGRVVRDLPVLILLTHRHRSEPEGGPLSVSRQPHFQELPLGPLGDADIARLIANAVGDSLPPELALAVRALGPRAEGNPFYAAELVQYILGLGPTALDPARLAEMPSSLQSLVLSRIDRLDTRPRTTVRVAGVIGRTFETDVLVPVHHDADSAAALAPDLDALEQARLVSGEDADRERYSFIHAVTQEVAYSTTSTNTRADLHGRIGRVIEARPETDSARRLELLAHHFARSDDADRRRRYVLEAAHAAQARYANAAAIELYRNVLPLLEGAARREALLDLGRTLGLTGAWPGAEDAFVTAARESERDHDDRLLGVATTERAEVLRKQGRLAEAAPLFESARTLLEQGGFAPEVADVLHYEGTLAAQRGDYDTATQRYTESLASRRELGDQRGQARSLNGLGIVAEYEGRLAEASELYQHALAILVELGDVWGTAALTNNAGMALLLQDDAAGARPLFERAVALQREIGDPQMLANFLSNLGDAARELGDLDAAASTYAESLALADQVDELWLIAYLFEDVAMLAASRGAAAAALRMAAAGARLRSELGTPLPAQSQARLEERLGIARAALTPDESDAATSAGADLAVTDAVAQAQSLLVGIGSTPQ